MKTTQKFLTAAGIATFIAVVLAGASSTKKTPATVITNKSDYTPGDTVTITGSGFAPNESVSLHIAESNNTKPWDNFATPDAFGNFSNSQFAVPPDFGVTFSLSATGLSSSLTATTTFTSSGQAPSAPSSPAGSLNQYRNGKVGCNSGPCVACSPADVAGWVNGNAGASNSHYVEGQSIPYREVMTNVPAGTVTIVLEYDTLHSGVHAIDYLTSFQRINEPVNPLDGLNGQGNNPPPPVGGPSTFPIPTPADDTAHGSPINCPTPPPFSGNGANQPTTSFANLAAAPSGCLSFGGPENMTIYGGTITSIDYNGAVDGSDPNHQNVTSGTGQASTRIRITFTTSGGTVVLAWGGHIASRSEWGCPTAPQSAGGISGSPYHMRQITWNLNNLGNQDRSLSANAVVVPCPICLSDTVSGPDKLCPGSAAQTYTATNPDPQICTTPAFTWTIINNTSGASIVGSNTGSSVSVNPGTKCGSYELQVSIACQTCTGNAIVCSKVFTTVDTTPPVITATGTTLTLGCNPSAADINGALGTATATDNCGSVTPTPSDSAVSSTGCSRSQTRTWNVTDACGNAATPVSRTVTWTVDTSPPVILLSSGSCGDSTTQSCADRTPHFPTASANDNCNGDLGPPLANPNPVPATRPLFYYVDSTPSAGTFVRTWHALDSCGNQETTCAFTVNIPPPCPCVATSSIASNFNGTNISTSNFIWFNANFTASGIPSTGATIFFQNSSVTITSKVGTFTYPVPDGTITFDPNATCASTTFSGGWVTTVPVSGSDEILLSALGIQAPANVKGANVTWTGNFSATAAGISINWKWGAAVYTTNMTNYNSLGVKPTHTNACSYPNNSDHAGTPETVKQFVIGGARGGGGSNFTGSWSGTQSVTPCVNNPAGANTSTSSLQGSSAAPGSSTSATSASNICPATGSLRTLTMTYEGLNVGGGTVAGNPGGLDAAYVTVNGGSPPNLFSGAVSFNSSTDPNSAYFVIDAGKGRTLPAQVTVTIYAARGGPTVSTVTFDTSCKQPLNVGDYFGSLRVSGGSK